MVKAQRQHKHRAAKHASSPQQGTSTPSQGVKSQGDEHLAGYIFICTDSTFDEAVEGGVFGAPQAELATLQRIQQHTPIFLYNKSKRTLHGIFAARGPGSLNLLPTAFRDGNSRASGSPYPAQVAVEIREVCGQLEEGQLKPILTHRFKKSMFHSELTPKQTLKLCRLFWATRDQQPAQPPPAGQAPQRGLGPELAGVIFTCNSQTGRECLQKGLFGLPYPHASYVLRIYPGMPVFLFNHDTRSLQGVFTAATYGGLNLDATAWSGHGSSTSRFPAQVKVRSEGVLSVLPEREFQPVLASAYQANNHHFFFELKQSEVDGLLALLKGQQAAIGSAPQAEAGSRLAGKQPGQTTPSTSRQSSPNKPSRVTHTRALAAAMKAAAASGPADPPKRPDLRPVIGQVKSQKSRKRLAAWLAELPAAAAVSDASEVGHSAASTAAEEASVDGTAAVKRLKIASTADLSGAIASAVAAAAAADLQARDPAADHAAVGGQNTAEAPPHAQYTPAADTVSAGQAGKADGGRPAVISLAAARQAAMQAVGEACMAAEPAIHGHSSTLQAKAPASSPASMPRPSSPNAADQATAVAQPAPEVSDVGSTGTQLLVANAAKVNAQPPVQPALQLLPTEEAASQSSMDVDSGTPAPAGTPDQPGACDSMQASGAPGGLSRITRLFNKLGHGRGPLTRSAAAGAAADAVRGSQVNPNAGKVVHPAVSLLSGKLTRPKAQHSRRWQDKWKAFTGSGQPELDSSQPYTAPDPSGQRGQPQREIEGQEGESKQPSTAMLGTAENSDRLVQESRGESSQLSPAADPPVQQLVAREDSQPSSGAGLPGNSRLRQQEGQGQEPGSSQLRTPVDLSGQGAQPAVCGQGQGPQASLPNTSARPSWRSEQPLQENQAQLEASQPSAAHTPRAHSSPQQQQQQLDGRQVDEHWDNVLQQGAASAQAGAAHAGSSLHAASQQAVSVGQDARPPAQPVCSSGGLEGQADTSALAEPAKPPPATAQSGSDMPTRSSSRLARRRRWDIPSTSPAPLSSVPMQPSGHTSQPAAAQVRRQRLNAMTQTAAAAGEPSGHARRLPSSSTAPLTSLRPGAGAASGAAPQAEDLRPYLPMPPTLPAMPGGNGKNQPYSHLLNASAQLFSYNGLLLPGQSAAFAHGSPLATAHMSFQQPRLEHQPPGLPMPPAAVPLGHPPPMQDLFPVPGSGPMAGQNAVVQQHPPWAVLRQPSPAALPMHQLPAPQGEAIPGQFPGPILGPRAPPLPVPDQQAGSVSAAAGAGWQAQQGVSIQLVTHVPAQQAAHAPMSAAAGAGEQAPPPPSSQLLTEPAMAAETGRRVQQAGSSQPAAQRAATDQRPQQSLEEQEVLQGFDQLSDADLAARLGRLAAASALHSQKLQATMRGVLECRQLLGQRSEQRGKGSALDAGRSAMQQLLDVTNLKGLDGLLSVLQDSPALRQLTVLGVVSNALGAAATAAAGDLQSKPSAQVQPSPEQDMQGPQVQQQQGVPQQAQVDDQQGQRAQHVQQQMVSPQLYVHEAQVQQAHQQQIVPQQMQLREQQGQHAQHVQQQLIFPQHLQAPALQQDAPGPAHNAPWQMPGPRPPSGPWPPQLQQLQASAGMQAQNALAMWPAPVNQAPWGGFLPPQLPGHALGRQLPAQPDRYLPQLVFDMHRFSNPAESEQMQRREAVLAAHQAALDASGHQQSRPAVNAPPDFAQRQHLRQVAERAAELAREASERVAKQAKLQAAQPQQQQLPGEATPQGQAQPHAWQRVALTKALRKQLHAAKQAGSDSLQAAKRASAKDAKAWAEEAAERIKQRLLAGLNLPYPLAYTLRLSDEHCKLVKLASTRQERQVAVQLASQLLSAGRPDAKPDQQAASELAGHIILDAKVSPLVGNAGDGALVDASIADQRSAAHGQSGSAADAGGTLPSAQVGSPRKAKAGGQGQHKAKKSALGVRNGGVQKPARSKAMPVRAQHPGAVLPPTVTCDRLAGETYVVLDTNVYIHRKHQKGLVFLRFVATHSHLGSTNEIFLVPDVVIHELQALGESERPVAAAAREAAQVLNAYRNSGLVHFQQPEERFVMQKGGNHVRPRPGDTGILDCIRYFQSQGATVKLCTYDRKFLVRAQRFAIPIVTVADLQTHLSNLLGKEKKGMMFDAKTGKIRLRHPDQAARLAAGEISQRLWDQSDSNMAVDGLSGSSSSRDEDQDGANAQCSSSDDGSDDGSDGEGPTAAADASAAPDDSPAVQVAPGMAGTSSGQGAVQTAGAFGEATHPSDQQQSAAVEHAKQRPAGGPGQPDPGLFVSEGWLALD